MDMGAHMKMTSLRQPKPGDAQRSQQVVEAARRASEKYKDYHAALADGFQIFLPNVPQKMYYFTNYGYATEAAREMLRYGFESLGLHRIFATCFPYNPASGRILKKLGMQYEGCQREHLSKWGQFVDSELYGILWREWEARE